MSIPAHAEYVNFLKNQYIDGVIYDENRVSVNAGGTIECNTFIGSNNVVALGSKDSIIIDSPGCIAAPLITIVAKNIISFGTAECEDESVPVRLYAPLQLSITANHLILGDIKILRKAETIGYIFCNKLDLYKFTEEEPSYFEIVKGWVMNEDTEIEIIDCQV